MDEDEEVIVEGSSLYSHLRGVGYDDFAVSTSQNVRTDLEKTIKETKLHQQDEKIKKGMKNSFFVWFSNFYNISSLRKDFLRHFVIKIINSKLLEEDDLFTLDYLSPTANQLLSDVHSTINPENPAKNRKKYFCNILYDFSSLLIPSFIMGIISIVISQILMQDLPNKEIHSLLIFTIVFFIVLSFPLFFKTHFQKDIKRVNYLITTLSASNKIIFKSLKTLNEIKVIGKGFLSIDSSKHEISLLNGVSYLMTEISLIIIKSHDLISQKKPSVGLQSTDSLFNHRFFPIIFQNDSELSELKINRNSLINQFSAFFTELILHIEKHTECTVTPSIRHIITLKEISKIEKLNCEIESLRQLASDYWFDERDIESLVRKSNQSYEVVKGDVNGALDTLYIHSRLAVNYILTLRNLFKDDFNQQGDILQDVQKCYDSIKNEFISCIGCLDEVTDRIQRYYFTSYPTSISQLGRIENEDVASSPEEQKPLPLYGLQDNIVQDEVFEAIAEVACANSEDDSGWMVDRKHYKNFKKEQKERCKRVLQEIQPILFERREMWKEREQQALERMSKKDERIAKKTVLENVLEHTIESEEDGSIVEEIPMMNVNDALNLNKETSGDKPFLYEIDDEYMYRRTDDDDYDSDEERLDLYRKVKKELEEDDKRRLYEERRILSEEKKYCNNKLNENKFNKNDDQNKLNDCVESQYVKGTCNIYDITENSSRIATESVVDDNKNRFSCVYPMNDLDMQEYLSLKNNKSEDSLTETKEIKDRCIEPEVKESDMFRCVYPMNDLDSLFLREYGCNLSDYESGENFIVTDIKGTNDSEENFIETDLKDRNDSEDNFIETDLNDTINCPGGTVDEGDSVDYKDMFRCVYPMNDLNSIFERQYGCKFSEYDFEIDEHSSETEIKNSCVATGGKSEESDDNKNMFRCVYPLKKLDHIMKKRMGLKNNENYFAGLKNNASDFASEENFSDTEMKEKLESTGKVEESPCEDSSSNPSSPSSCSVGHDISRSSSSQSSPLSSSLTHPSAVSSLSMSPLEATVTSPSVMEYISIPKTSPKDFPLSTSLTPSTSSASSACDIKVPPKKVFSRADSTSSDSDNEGEKRRIDWSISGFPSVRKLPPEERFTPEISNPFPSLGSPLVRLTDGEVFKGFGEGEEFGDSEDEDKP